SGSSGDQCSSGTQCGSTTSGSVAGFCSAQAGTIGGGTQTNNCSVTNDGTKGTPNTCSTTYQASVQTTCSTHGAAGSNTTDFCSVTSSSFNNAVCTTIAGFGQSDQTHGFCSAAN